MKRKRLDRDTWWEFKGGRKPEYYQLRHDSDRFHGMVCVLKLLEGEYHYWNFQKSGKVEVTGAGMVWLQLLPDDSQHLITAFYKPENRILLGVEYPERVTVWYVDTIEGYDYDTDGVIVYNDIYLDVIFTPVGDVMIADRDELDEALSEGDITIEQYHRAIAECERVVDLLCSDIEKTEVHCAEILTEVKERIANGEGRLPTANIDVANNQAL